LQAGQTYTLPRQLSSESVQGTSLPLEGVHHVERSHGLTASVLSVGDSITDDVLEEHLQDTTGLLVDESRDTLDSSTTSQTANGGLGDSLDVVTQHLSVALGTTLSEAFTSFTASGHDIKFVVVVDLIQLRINCAWTCRDVHLEACDATTSHRHGSLRLMNDPGGEDQRRMGEVENLARHPAVIK
jgi:hypothetical protein